MRASHRRLQSVLSVATTSASEQMTKLRRQASASSSNTSSAVVAEAFPSWGFLTLPPLLGKFRDEGRTQLKSSEELKQHVSSSMLDAPTDVNVRSVIVGSKCSGYIARQLNYSSTQVLVLDHDLGRLTECAFQLRPKYGHRVSFIRCDAAFAMWGLLPRNFIDVIVFAMPVPHISKQASHRRLLTRDTFHLCHPILKCRESPNDAKGLVVFSDSLPYAEFAAAQLDECKLLVPWARKRPDVFERWLPKVEEDGWSSHIHTKGSLSSAAPDPATALHSVAAAKSGETTSHALKLAESFDFRRRYFDALVADNAPPRDA
ncbi:Hypothetical protein, putative [Bodo saltans]|uniref:Uncharacterized protein n=1 Tax=Bodo saltans TaxID=75058 RepID=A0A0S4JL57_BODSA|nr:Hypothetical protein, putative [Bodo saltans]|eukprot:CUG92260.1 Hypothetical protein, putative [Bodo saltans]